MAAKKKSAEVIDQEDPRSLIPSRPRTNRRAGVATTYITNKGNPRANAGPQPRGQTTPPELTEDEKEFFHLKRNPNGTYRLSRKAKYKGVSPTKFLGKDWKNPLPTNPDNMADPDRKICGYQRRGTGTDGVGVCCQPAGWGTDHTGVGPCKFHGGTTDAGKIMTVRRAIEERFQLLDNAELQDHYKGLSPDAALLMEVRRTAMHVDWLHDLIQFLGSEGDPTQEEELRIPKGLKALYQVTEKGTQTSALMKIYQEERAHLVKVSKTAIDAGVALRQVQIEQDTARMIVHVIQAILGDPILALTNEQKVAVKQVIRGHILTIGSGHPLAVESGSDSEIAEAEVL